MSATQAANIYYSDKYAQVTGEAIIMRGKVYPLEAVEAVRVWQDKGVRREWPYVALLAVTLLLFGGFNGQNLIPEDWADVVPTILTVDVLFAIGVVGVLLMQMFLKGDEVYMIGLRGTFGLSDPLCCEDGGHAQHLADAIRMAMLNRVAPAPV